MFPPKQNFLENKGEAASSDENDGPDEDYVEKVRATVRTMKKQMTTRMSLITKKKVNRVSRGQRANRMWTKENKAWKKKLTHDDGFEGEIEGQHVSRRWGRECRKPERFGMAT